MPNISPIVMTHKLNVYPDAKPINQKKTMFRAEKREATRSEVEKLIKARFIRKVTYPEWLTNSILANKSNGKYCMCIDFR